MQIVIEYNPKEYGVRPTYKIYDENEDDCAVAIAAIGALIDVIADISDDPILEDRLVKALLDRFGEEDVEENDGQI